MVFLSAFLGQVGIAILFGGLGIYIALLSKTKFASVFVGLLIGSSAILVIQYPLVMDGSFDIDHIVLTFAGYIGGTFASFSAASVSSLYRWFEGGIEVSGGIISLWVFGLLGIWLKTKVAFRLNNIKDIGVVLGLGVLMAIIELEIMIISWDIQSLAALADQAIAMLILTPLGTIIIYAMFFFIHRGLTKSLFFDSLLNSPLKVMSFDEKGAIWVSDSLKEDPAMRKYVADPSLLASGVDIKKLYEEKGIIDTELVTGDRRTISITLSPVKLSKDNYALISFLSDTTKAKEIEKEMVRLDRLNLVGEMAASIGHEIRNPMTTVRGFLQLIGQQKVLPPKKQYFDLMIEEIDKANGIITEFLTFANNKTVELNNKNLNTISLDLLPLIEAAAVNWDTTIRTELGDIPDLLLDEREIRQIIINMVHNGLQAMPKGKSLTIRTFTENDEVILSVEDEGEGIAEEVLDRIGTPFFTTKEEGTGLGLAICYSIAARHNARITVDSSPGRTIFFVRFKHAAV